jgi:hypothetical protein
MTNSHRIVRAIVASTATAALATGCGNAINADLIGMTAVSVDEQGKPVVVVAVCSQHVDQVEVVGGREGLDANQPNPAVGSWTSEKQQTGTFTIDVAQPGDDWTSSAPVRLEANRQYIVIASRSDADSEATQVSFRGGDLTTLEPGQLIVRDHEVWTRAKFDQHACD